MAEQQAPLKTYRGNCHCAAYVYEITLPEINEASECNCSICYKRGAIWAFPNPSDVKFVKGDPATLTDYNFNNGKFTHSSCPTCGVAVMVSGHLTPATPGKLPENGFNLRTLQYGQVDIQNLSVKTFDGRSLPPQYEAPVFTGPEPTGEVEGGQMYSGSCHCGAVTVGLKSKPLTKETQGLVECNCSICGKYGATWTYPHHTEVVIEGRENLAEPYVFGKKLVRRLFCKTCCIPIGSEVVQLPDEQVELLDERTRQWYDARRYLTSINLRIVNGLDVKDLTTNKFNGYNLIQPGYVEP